jgi:hypothetical protein
LATSKIKTPNTHIGKVILCLGTNDVTRNKDDSDQINITATQAISKIASCLFSSILFTIISRVTTLLAERTNGLIVTVSSNVSYLITVVATYNASGFVSTKTRGWSVVQQYLHSVRLLSAKILTSNLPKLVLFGDAQIQLNETFHVDRHNLNNNETVQKKSDITKSSGNNVNIILGASNAKRLGQYCSQLFLE